MTQSCSTTRTSSPCGCCRATSWPGSRRSGRRSPRSRSSSLSGSPRPEPGGRLEPRVEPRVHGATASRSRCGPTTNRAPSRAPAGRLRRGARAAARRDAPGRRRRRRTSLDRVAEAQRAGRGPRPHPALADADRELLGNTLRRLRRAIGEARRRRAAAARRAASGQPAQHEGRPAVHRLRDLLPRAGRVRYRPCARGGRRALSGRRSGPAPRVPAARACDGRGLALGPQR